MATSRAGKGGTRALRFGAGLWLDQGGGAPVSARRIALLEAIGTHGSITAAAKAVGLSYKAAWDAVDAMNNLSTAPLVVRATGGRHGGGTQLTDHGRQLVELYRKREGGQRRMLERLQGEMHDATRLNEALRSIALKTSARNQLRGTVTKVHRGAVNADVVLAIGDGLEIFANITREAVDELDLKRGREAVALIKSSFVLLSPDPDIRISARNRLPGTVASIAPGAVNCEVKLQLAGSRTLIAIVTREGLKQLGLRSGSPCVALVKASHVLIAVND